MKRRIIIIIIFLLAGYSDCKAKDYYLKIHFIDVGEGDSILIQAGNESAVIDTGGLLSGHRLTQYLKQNNAAEINHLVITHHDLDHIMGAFFIIPELKIENVYDNGFKLNTSADQVLGYFEKIFRSNKNYRVLKAGDVLRLGYASLKVIWPPPAPLSGSYNHNSLVIILTYKDFRCLLAADIDKAAEMELLNNKTDLSAEVLKVAHHGAKDATSLDFIKKAGPRFAIISVDNNNPRGYPDRSVLDLLEGENIKVYRTDVSGSLIIAANNKTDCIISAEKPR